MKFNEFISNQRGSCVTTEMIEQEFYRIMRGAGYFDQIRFRYDFFHKELKELYVWRLLLALGAGMYSRCLSLSPADLEMSIEEFSKKYIQPITDSFLIEV